MTTKKKYIHSFYIKGEEGSRGKIKEKKEKKIGISSYEKEKGFYKGLYIFILKYFLNLLFFFGKCILVVSYVSYLS